MTPSERFAIAFATSYTPDSMDYQDIITAIDEQYQDGEINEDITIWEPMEQLSADELIDHIGDMECAFRLHAQEVTKDLRDAIKNGDPLTIAEQLAKLEAHLKGDK